MPPQLDQSNWPATGGDVAEEMAGREIARSIVGAMDLAADVKRTVVVLEHVNKLGAVNLSEQSTSPLTRDGTVNTVTKDLGEFGAPPRKAPPSEISARLGVAFGQS
jgi:3-oxoacid CoA-transferase subunit B/3-oxoadipate CoA-transferase beta subunit